MSNEDIVLSLSPTGAEDESLSGTHSVLALMRMSKDLMNRHLSVIGQIHSSLTEGELLSTVMGNLDLSKTRASERKALIAEQPKLMILFENIVLADPIDGPATVAAVRTELHALISRSIETALSSAKMKQAAELINMTIEKEVISPLEKSMKLELKRAAAMLNQCIILSTGARTGQPFKKDQAIITFDEDVKFLNGKVDAMKTCRGYLEEARKVANELRTSFSLIEQITDPVTSSKLTKLEQVIDHNVHSIEALTKEIVSRFNDGAQIISKDRLKQLSIPADVIEKCRGTMVRSELQPWIKQNIDKLWAIAPWFYRILNDYDALNGEYWKPPTYEEAQSRVPETIRNEWIRANRTLAATLKPILGEQFMNMFTCTYSYGANGLKTTKADEDNGLELIYALVTRSSPNSSAYRDSIDKQMHNCAELCKSGNPVDFVKQARICLLECIRLNIAVRWHVARQIIDILAQRHNLYSRDLKAPREICRDSEDCAPEFDALLTRICDINDTIRESSGDTWWTDSRNMAMGMTTSQAPNVGTPDQWCKFGKDCTKRATGMCKRSHDPTMSHQPKGKGGKGKSKGKASKGKGASNSTKGAARCAKKGCSETSSAHGDLCGGCWTKAKAEGGYTNLYGKQIPVIANSDRQKDRKAAKADLKATANSAKVDKHDDDEQPETLEMPVKRIYMSIDEYNQLMNKKVKITNTTDNNILSGIGERLGKYISGPASYKQRLVSEFLKDDLNKNVDISKQIDGFIDFVKKNK